MDHPSKSRTLGENKRIADKINHALTPNLNNQVPFQHPSTRVATKRHLFSTSHLHHLESKNLPHPVLYDSWRAAKESDGFRQLMSVVLAVTHLNSTS